MGVFERLKLGLARTRERLTREVARILAVVRPLDDALIDELEEALLTSDIGVAAATRLVEEVRKAHRAGNLRDSSQVRPFLIDRIATTLAAGDPAIRFAASGPTVILVAGVNGVGKTTSIAKLANLFKSQGRRVILAAGDTFRAAAVEQLEIWAGRAGVEIVRHEGGSDPAAVAFDAVDAAVARKADVVIIDTAGRLHTREELMRQLTKIRGVCDKKVPGAPHETILVLDATTGQNALSQARLFHSAAPVTGLFLTKLDGTAKGGIVVALSEEMKLPVKFVGVGEGMDDIEPFDPAAFARALIGE